MKISNFYQQQNRTYCYEKNPCSTAFDLTIFFQTSDKIDEEEFDRIKNILSEILRRYRVEINYVHLGIVAITDQSRTFLSGDKRNQGPKKHFSFLIDSLQDLPFVQHPRSELKKILQETRDEMFIYRERDGELNGKSKYYKVINLITTV